MAHKRIRIHILFLFLFLTLAQQAQADSITNYNPVSHWTLDETSGVRYDSTSSNNDLTDNNTVLYGTGVQENSADFELSNSEYLSITDASQTGLDFTDYSISFWIKLEQLPSTAGTTFEVISKVFGNGDTGYRIFIPTSNKISVYFWGTGGDGDTTDITTSAVFESGDVGTWVHIVVTESDGDASGSKVYKNGVSQIMSYDGTRATTMGNSSNPFVIGKDSSGSSSYTDAMIDEVSTFNVILSSTQVTAIYNSGTGLCYATCTSPEEPPATSTASTTETTSTSGETISTHIFRWLMVFFATFFGLIFYFKKI